MALTILQPGVMSQRKAHVPRLWQILDELWREGQHEQQIAQSVGNVTGDLADADRVDERNTQPRGALIEAIPKDFIAAAFDPAKRRPHLIEGEASRHWEIRRWDWTTSGGQSADEHEIDLSGVLLPQFRMRAVPADHHSDVAQLGVCDGDTAAFCDSRRAPSPTDNFCRNAMLDRWAR